MNTICGESPVMNRLPFWLRKSLMRGKEAEKTDRLINDLGLNTICQSGKCPNRDECYSMGTATFMIMGDRCTRSCRYCAVTTGKPLALDPDEPRRIATAVQKLRLEHAVITAVTRDDLADEGAGHFAQVVREIRRRNPGIVIEVLTQDFRRDQDKAAQVFRTLPFDIFNHNIETVRRLHRTMRPGGGYDLSLKLLEKMSRFEFLTKSGIMLGLGETADEVIEVMKELKRHGCQMLTLGQYLKPSPSSAPVVRYLRPSEFEEYRRIGYNIGFLFVESGPFVRSSYHAKDSFDKLKEILGKPRMIDMTHA